MSARTADTGLRIDWVDRKAACWACEHWHYSRRAPHPRAANIGVWENGSFRGVVIFNGGATPNIAKPFGLERSEVVELIRVALAPHAAPVSRILAIATRMMVRRYRRLQLMVSFADTSQGHHGGIYQAAGWTYVGSTCTHDLVVNGKVTHPRTLGSKYGRGGQSLPWLRKHVDPNASRRRRPAKHEYVLPLSDAMRTMVATLKKPYPKRAGSIAGDATANQAEKGGSIPTSALS